MSLGIIIALVLVKTWRIVMIRGILIGIVIGFVFKPQIEQGLRKLVTLVRKNLHREA